MSRPAVGKEHRQTSESNVGITTGFRLFCVDGISHEGGDLMDQPPNKHSKHALAVSCGAPGRSGAAVSRRGERWLAGLDDSSQ